MEELYTLDKDSCEKLYPIYGLIFLFKYREEERELSASRPGTLDKSPHIFFANQVIRNACATQAILSIILNADQIQAGDELTSFKEFTKDFDPMMRGDALSNSETIRAAHNEYAPQQSFVFDEKISGEQEDAYHFISYVPIKGKVYELDGLQEGPRMLGEVAEGVNWIDVVTPIIQARIQEYAGNEIRFNLMAVVEERPPKLKALVDEAKKRLEEIDQGKDPEDFAKLQDALSNHQNNFAAETGKRETWARENRRRKHSFIPFIMGLLKLMAEKKQLEPVVSRVGESKRQEFQRQREAANKSGSKS